MFPSEKVVKSIYDIHKGQDYWKFHITSNYDGQAIEDKVGATSRSRMIEMFNMIKLEGVDRRKK
jgi:hypothetical protein